MDKIRRSADRGEDCTLRHSESKKLINSIDSRNNDMAKKEARIAYLQKKVDQLLLKLQSLRDENAEKDDQLQSLCDEHNVENVDQLQLKVQSLCDEHNVENVDQLQLKLRSLCDEHNVENVNQLQLKLRSLRDAEKELSEARNEIERLEKERQMLSEEDEKFLAIYEAEAEHQPDCCKLCNAKEIHGDPKCMNCGHSQSSHRERCYCGCTEFKGEKKGMCSECSHPRAQHTKKRCTSCGNCGGFEKHTIALSHAYPKAVLTQICGDEDICSIFDGRRYEAVTAATCKRHQLCTKCELSFSTKEARFAERLQGCLSDPPCDDGEEGQVDADVLLLSTFRAFQHSVRYGQFKICCKDGHTCKKVYHKIRSWIVRAKKAILDSAAPEVTGIHHISTVTPIPPKHLSEFPIVCEVEVQGQCYPIIYAQIPPFYWAYSLDENPTITETLRVNFAEVIEVVNAELVNQREIFFADDVQACHWKEESCKKQTEIETKKFEWNELSDEVTKMKKDCAQHGKFPHTHRKVKEKETKEREAYNALHTLQTNHVPLEGLVLVIAYLSPHCLKVKIDAPKPQATFCT